MFKFLSCPLLLPPPEKIHSEFLPFSLSTFSPPPSPASFFTFTQCIFNTAPSWGKPEQVAITLTHVDVPHADNRDISSSQTAMATLHRLSFTLESGTSRESCVCVVCQAFTWNKPFTCDIQSPKSVWIHSFEIYSKWSVQTNQQINRHTHTLHNAVTLVWGLLRLTPTTWCVPTLGLRHNVETTAVTNPGLGEEGQVPLHGGLLHI